MRFLLISLVFILLTSCSSITKNYILLKEKQVQSIENTYFSDNKKDYVYKAKIDIYGNYIGGIVVIKRLAENYHRIVFTTEFGAKMLDFEIKNGELIKNKVVEKLDRKIILNTLKNDFEILLQEKANVLGIYTFNTNLIYKTFKGKRFNLYFYNQEKQLVKIINASKRKEKVEILFSDFEENNLQRININHKNIKLAIDLKHFK